MTPKLVRVGTRKLTGQHPDLWGDCSGLRGNLDSCGLTDEDRVLGVDIRVLVTD